MTNDDYNFSRGGFPLIKPTTVCSGSPGCCMRVNPSLPLASLLCPACCCRMTPQVYVIFILENELSLAPSASSLDQGIQLFTLVSPPSLGAI